MTMSRYNKSLDYTVLALAACANGEHETAAKLLVKASRAPDVERAVEILEASNAQAFDAHQKQVQAATKAAKAKATAAAAKPAPKIEAAKRVAAAEAAPAKTQVKAFDMGDEADVDRLLDNGEGFEDVAEDEDEVVEEAAVEEDEDDEEFDKTFASVLKGMAGKKR
jgi:hypothetical protein